MRLKRSRSILDIPTPYTPEELNEVLAQFMKDKGFNLVDYKGAQVMKKNNLIAPIYLQTEIEQGTVHIEAWVWSFGEQGLNGFAGTIPKRRLLYAIKSLIAVVSPSIPPQQEPVL